MANKAPFGFGRSGGSQNGAKGLSFSESLKLGWLFRKDVLWSGKNGDGGADVAGHLAEKQPAILAAVLQVRRSRVGSVVSPWELYLVKVISSGYIVLHSARKLDQEGRPVAMVSLCGTLTELIRGNMLRITRKRSRERITLKFSSQPLVMDWMKKLSDLGGMRVPGISDFKIMGALGKGAHGNVFLARERHHNAKLAIKVVDKSHAMASGKNFEHAMNERLVLEMVRGSKYFVRLVFAFQTRDNFYMVTDLQEGGDLHEYQRRHGPWTDFRRLRTLLCEIILALDYLHDRNVAYRDLKLENILINRDGHIRLADFGLAKPLEQAAALTSTVCGTNAFAAPEIFESRAYGVSVDLYALGVLMYVLINGDMPKGAAENQVNLRALGFLPRTPRAAAELCVSLLHPDPSKRLGCGPFGMQDVKNHHFFTDVRWNHMHEEEPPFAGYVDTTNFYRNFDISTVAKVHFDDTDDDFSYTDAAIWPLKRTREKSLPERFVAGYSFSTLRARPW